MTKKEALKICKLLTSTPTHMALLTEMHDNGPRYRRDIIKAVLAREDLDLSRVGSWSDVDTIVASFIKLVKYGLIKRSYIKNSQRRRTYSVNTELINEAMEKKKKTIGAIK